MADGHLSADAKLVFLRRGREFDHHHRISAIKCADGEAGESADQVHIRFHFLAPLRSVIEP